MKLPKSSWLIFLALVAATSSHAAEITGTVQTASGDTATIAIEGDAVPNVGDKAEIFFKLAGADEEISVGSGKVTEVSGTSIKVKIDNTTGTVEKGQRARITSEKGANPKGTTSPVPATPSPSAPSSADITPSPSTEEAKRSSLVGKWIGETQGMEEATIEFKSDGSVVIPFELSMRGVSVVGKYSVDLAATPPRFEIADCDFVFSPALTDQERQAAQEGLKKEKEKDPHLEKLAEGRFVGEVNGATRIRIKLFTKLEAAAKPKIEGNDVAVFKKVAPGENDLLASPSPAATP
jgi:hypothetical protein